MSDLLIRAENVSKKFCRTLRKSLWYGMLDLGSELLGRRSGGNGELREDEFWAVRDVSFELRRGECLGLIGHNGAGKTTLLRMLNGLIKPDAGRIEIRGRVGALIALGAGFNPVLTGRENIYINASILGLSADEIKERIDDIIDFAELREFIDSPVQSYSSGMQVRLGFAVATALEPDILLLDEVLAVGDAGFRGKCYNRISNMAKNSAIIFVSHSMSSISRLAKDVIVLNNGRVSCYGRKDRAISEYNSSINIENSSERIGNGLVKIKHIQINSSSNYHINVNYCDPVIIDMTVESSIHITDMCIDIVFTSLSESVTAECNSLLSNKPICLEVGQVLGIQTKIDKLTLNGGIYKVSALLLSNDMVTHYDWMKDFATINVHSEIIGVAGNQFIADWNILS